MLFKKNLPSAKPQEPSMQDLKVAYEILYMASRDIDYPNKQEINTGKDRVMACINRQLKRKGEQ